MTPMATIEIGLVLYSGAQQASVLGLTDLFCIANRIAASLHEQAEPLLRVTHWQQQTAGEPADDNALDLCRLVAATFS